MHLIKIFLIFLAVAAVSQSIESCKSVTECSIGEGCINGTCVNLGIKNIALATVSSVICCEYYGNGCVAQICQNQPCSTDYNGCPFARQYPSCNC